MRSGQDDQPRLTYFDRLATFRDSYWTDADATARQLAALGHISDRLPRERYEEGSRCATCSLFISKEISVHYLEGDVNPEHFKTIIVPPFHTTHCTRNQVRLPYETPRWFMESKRLPVHSHEAASSALSGETTNTKIGLLSLPTELRLLIYKLMLPYSDRPVKVAQRDRDMMRMCIKGEGRNGEHSDVINAFHCPLLQVCSTTRRELGQMLYGRTKFEFRDTRSLYMFLRRIGRCGRANISHAVVRNVGKREDALAFALLASCEALSSFRIVINRTALLPADKGRHSPWLEDGVACLVSISGVRAEHVNTSFVADHSGGVMPNPWQTTLPRAISAYMLKALLSRKRGTPVIWHDVVTSSENQGPFGSVDEKAVTSRDVVEAQDRLQGTYSMIRPIIDVLAELS